MANRGSTAAFQTEIVKDRTTTFLLFEVYFDAGTQYFSNFDVPVDWNSNTYVATGAFLSIGDIEEVTGSHQGTMRVQFQATDRTWVTNVLSTTFLGRRVVVRRAFWTGTAVLVDPVIMFDGIMDSPRIKDEGPGGGTTVEITALEGGWNTFRRKPGRRTTTASQETFFAGDTFFDTVPDTPQNLTWGRPS